MPDIWDDSLSVEIKHVIRDKNIESSDFRSLSVTENLLGIEDRIYDTFCSYRGFSYKNDRIEKPVWLWEFFKLDTYSISSDYATSYKYLNWLVDKDEIVWFFINGDQDKFWFYEGKIGSIVTVIEECSCLDELYVASKKYKWLICINHHDTVIATGETMPDRLRTIGNSKELP